MWCLPSVCCLSVVHPSIHRSVINQVDFFAFAPFSLGERSCLGRRFAHIEIVTALAMIAKARHQDATHTHA